MNISKMYRFGLLHLFLLTIIILLNRHIVSGQTRVTNNNSNESVVKETKINDNKNNFRNAKSTNTPYKELLSCAITLDGRCFLDQSENLLRFHYHKLWGNFCLFFFYILLFSFNTNNNRLYVLR